MAVTITLPDDLIERLHERGIRDAETLNRYAVAAISAYLDEGSDTATMPATPALREDEQQAVDEAFADIEAGRVRPLESAFSAFYARHGIAPRATD